MPARIIEIYCLALLRAEAGMDRIVLHIDFDYFYAQCEETRDPPLRAAPLVVCVFSGRSADSGAVATANYVARGHGVKSGMPISLARRRLAEAPDAKFLPVDFGFYEDISARGMEIMRAHADVFEYVGRDEAYLDITSRSSGNYGSALHVAQQIKNDIRTALSLTCSIGVSPNRLVSKIASDYQKPDGLTVVEPSRVEDFLAPLGVRKIPGLGRRAEESLTEMGIATVSDLRGYGVFDLVERFGRHMGTYLHNAAAGRDETPVAERAPNAQYSKIATLERDSEDFGFVSAALPGLCSAVHEAVSAKSLTFKSVSVQAIRSDMAAVSRSTTLRSPASTLAELERAASSLLRDLLDASGGPVRRIGVRVAELGQARGQRSIDDY